MAAALTLGACGGPGEPSKPGIVLLVVETSGLPTDPDGYAATVDAETRSVGTNDSLAFADVPSGRRTITLDGLAANCTPSPTLPATITVVAGDTLRFTIAVTCVTTTGALTFDMTTSGYDVDPDGYTISLDGGESRALGIDGSVGYSLLPAGPHTVQVGGAAANCAITAPPEATVVVGVNTHVSLAAACQGPMRDVILFTDWDGHLMSVRSDGTGLQPVTHDGNVYGNGVVSPDGMRVAALTMQQGGPVLVVMTNDGDDNHPIVSTGVPIDQIAWTPDGRLAIAQGPIYNSWPDLCFLQSDGSDRHCTTVEGGHLFFGDFALSPDASRVVYSVGGGFAFMDVDGSHYSTLPIPVESHMPDWSPDGARIAFQQVEDFDGDGQLEAEIVVMNVDGSNLVRLTHNSVVDQYPKWSPDGSRLLYLSTAPNGSRVLHVMDASGANDRKLTPVGSAEQYGTWSPVPAGP